MERERQQRLCCLLEDLGDILQTALRNTGLDECRNDDDKDRQPDSRSHGGPEERDMTMNIQQPGDEESKDGEDRRSMAILRHVSAAVHKLENALAAAAKGRDQLTTEVSSLTKKLQAQEAECSKLRDDKKGSESTLRKAIRVLKSRNEHVEKRHQEMLFANSQLQQAVCHAQAQNR